MFVAKKHSGVGFVAGALTGERLGDYSYSVSPGESDHLSGPGDLGDEVKSMLESFVNYGI
jgi:hypothetical protein